MSPLFHLAFHVTDLEQTRRFYIDVLGAVEGRSTDTWIDFNLYGHQLSCHLGTPWASTLTGQVAGTAVPMPHFGIILPMPQWQQLVASLQQADIDFAYPPTLRFEGQPGEQGTFFIRDPSGNAIEMKGVNHDTEVFAR